MKTRISLFTLTMLMAGSSFAQGGATASGLPKELIWIIYFITFMMLILALFLYRISAQLRKFKNGEFDTQEQKMWDNRTMWEKIFQLKPMGTDKEVQMDHSYDGITELDNPPPPWFMFLFYGTILFAVIYYVRFQITGAGPTQEEEYIAEVEAATKKVADAVDEEALAIDENNVEYLTAEADIAAGLSIYTANCKICHAEGGAGSTGPNLTDEYWIHGGGIKNVFKTVKYGVPEKGMISWENTLNPEQMQQVASYILSIAGTNPEGGLDPQGEVWVEAEVVEEEAEVETTDSTSVAEE